MTDKPGFTVDEIAATYKAGGHIAAIKMLRAETQCTLREAADALRNDTFDQMPTFKEWRTRRKAERAGLRLLDALKALMVKVDPATRHTGEYGDAVRLILEIERE